ncbi:MAG: hydrogenase [Deltaproteobacteria bacterium]|nr:hydrogenase [Deltaproteobacteria bacterium]MBW2415208.1 hydrogenase [Deltaproteobacteria bacterium]
MAARDPGRRICFHGAVLILLGLLTGALIPIAANPRMGLSAHLAGVQNGILLLALGACWPHLRLGPRSRAACSHLATGSLYVLWFATLLAAVIGTSQATPIAGAGHEGAIWQEILVTTLFGAGSIAALGGFLLVVLGLRGRAQPELMRDA